PPVDPAPSPRAADALEDQVLHREVQRDDVVRGLRHHELVLAGRPGEDVEEDLLDVLLHRAQELLGIEGLELDEDRTEAPAGAELLARLEVLAARDLAAEEQVLPHALVGVAARGVDDAPRMQEDALLDVAVLEVKDAGLPAAEDRPQELGDARL